jgi:glutathione S-transferase
MKFYYNTLSTYSQKVLMALYEKNVPFEPSVVNLASPEGRAGYEAIYPIGKIPLLKPTEDYSIPESTIIIEYLEGHFPQGTRLIPEGIDAARQVRFCDRMCDLYLNDACVAILGQQRGFAPQTERQLASAAKHLKVSYGFLDKRLSNQEWLCGSFSMADCAALPPLFYCQEVAPFKDYPNIVQYFERGKKRSSYAKVLAELLPTLEKLTAQRAAQQSAA